MDFGRGLLDGDMIVCGLRLGRGTLLRIELLLRLLGLVVRQLALLLLLLELVGLFFAHFENSTRCVFRDDRGDGSQDQTRGPL